ncbi:MAG: Membrane-bound lytic murein transglycosylase precursor [Pseudomonadota bacterium]|jgi:membrane-bound lytic murein transglycosylase A|nr:MltA domain-containing protein [Limnohabitans sp.]
MVHQTIASKINNANNASNKIKPMHHLLGSWILGSLFVLGVFLLSACSSPEKKPTPQTAITPPKAPVLDSATAPENAPTVLIKPKSRWLLASWSDLPGFNADNFNEAWVAWRQNCARNLPNTQRLCADVRRLDGQPSALQKAWVMENFQPFRVEHLNAAAAPSNGLLTAYYEPVFEASRTPRPGFEVPLYGVPANLKARSPWFSREEIAKLPAAQAALKGKEIAYIASPVDAMVLHIQGSGRLWLTDRDGRRTQIRLAFAGTNEHPYQSIGRWLLDQNLTKDATWPGIKAWLAQNPRRTNELMWRNPRFIFFKEEALLGAEALLGPKGAMGVPLTPGRSIAVDPGSIPYGSAVWLSSSGPQTLLNRLVFAQDTGSAILGAVRADYFVGSGDAAGEVAGRLKQDMTAWVLLPR